MLIQYLLMPLLAGLINAEPQRGGLGGLLGGNGGLFGGNGGGITLGGPNGLLGLNLGGGRGNNNENRPGFGNGNGQGRGNNNPGPNNNNNNNNENRGRPEPAAEFRCNADNCLRALRRFEERLGNTCERYERDQNIRGPGPEFLPNECNSSRISSACRCLKTAEPKPTYGPPRNGNGQPPQQSQPAQQSQAPQPSQPPKQSQAPQPSQPAAPKPTQAPPAQSPRPSPVTPAPAPAPTTPPPAAQPAASSSAAADDGSGGTPLAYEESNSLHLSGNQIYQPQSGVPSKRAASAAPQATDLAFEDDDNYLYLEGDEVYTLPDGIPERR